MDSKTKQVAWNASEGLIMELTQRRSLANSYFISGKISKALNTLIAIKQSVIQSFLPKEREKFVLLEKKFNHAAPYLTISMGTSFNNGERKIYALSLKMAKEVYSEYNNLLMDLLEDRNYLIGEKTDASIMKF